MSATNVVILIALAWVGLLVLAFSLFVGTDDDDDTPDGLA